MFALRKEGENDFPTLSDMYGFFSPRSKKITAWCFGFSYGGIESEIMENVGCKVTIFDYRAESEKRLEIFSRVLSSHEVTAEDPEWAKYLTDKWVLPNLFTHSKELPWSFTGSLTFNEPFNTIKMELNNTPKIDLCKVDLPGLATHIVYNILDAGYRPGLFFICWEEHPDASNKTMICAGHLQSCGYKLLNATNDYFLYAYNDLCIYESCSWARSDVDNPMVEEIGNNYKNQGNIKENGSA
jgi:hypothetical protein